MTPTPTPLVEQIAAVRHDLDTALLVVFLLITLLWLLTCYSIFSHRHGPDGRLK